MALNAAGNVPQRYIELAIVVSPATNAPIASIITTETYTEGIPEGGRSHYDTRFYPDFRQRIRR